MSSGSPRLAFLPRLGFADRHEGPLADLYGLDFAALDLFVEERPSYTMSLAEIIYPPVDTITARLAGFIGVW